MLNERKSVQLTVTVAAFDFQWWCTILFVDEYNKKFHEQQKKFLDQWNKNRENTNILYAFDLFGCRVKIIYRQPKWESKCLLFALHKVSYQKNSDCVLFVYFVLFFFVCQQNVYKCALKCVTTQNKYNSYESEGIHFQWFLIFINENVNSFPTENDKWCSGPTI